MFVFKPKYYQKFLEIILSLFTIFDHQGLTSILCNVKVRSRFSYEHHNDLHHNDHNYHNYLHHNDHNDQL